MGFVRQVAGRTTLMIAVLALVLLGSASAGEARAIPVPDTSDQHKFYIVQPSDRLYQVAVDTLGNGNRYREIFELNDGREQPDGRRMTDPMTLRPGWVLVLPADAQGPGVRTTPPPTAPILSPSRRQRTVPVAVLAAVALFVTIAALAWWIAVSPARRAAVTGAVRAGRDRLRQRVRGRGLLRGFHGRARRTVLRLRRAPAVPAGPPAGIEDHGPPLTATLVTECGPIEVELTTGARGGRASYRWLGVFDPAPESALPIVLGLDQGSRLFVDLADCPDPFTITGSAPDCRRYAAGLARQLLAYGRSVQVVGDVLGVERPDACERLTTMPAVTGPSVPGRARLVITAGLRGHSLAELRQCLRQDDRSVAVIIIGDVLRSRWSVTLPPRGGTAEGASGLATAGATP